LEQRKKARAFYLGVRGSVRLSRAASLRYYAAPRAIGFSIAAGIEISQPGSPMTLGNAAAAKVRLIGWCRDCGHQVEPDPAELARRYGADMAEPDWREQLVCSREPPG
jgi:hypothetical protein